MKKLIVATATLLQFTTPLYPNWDRDVDWYSQFSIGELVTFSDAMGIGIIFPYDENGISVIQVEQALFGCTNQQNVAVRNNRDMLSDRMATPLPKDGRIVFLVYTNAFNINLAGDWRIGAEDPDWGPTDEMLEDPDLFKFYDNNGSCFPPDIDGGLVFTHVTNVIRVARTERNWTNYYEVVRSGVTSPS